MIANNPPPKDPRELAKHFADTYFSLRIGLAALAITLPFVLYLFGRFWHGLVLQPSMSAYFWAATAEHCATFPMRTIFVGFLFAVAISLYLYKGLTKLENRLLNAAAFCAGLVAIFPERLTPAEALTDPRIQALYENCPAVKAWSEQASWPIHHIAAISVFVLLAIVAGVCARKSLAFLPADADREKYKLIYKSISWAMILFPIPGLVVAVAFDKMTHWIFFVEAAGVITFGIYWAVKSWELALSGLERDPVEAVGHAVQRGTAPKP